MLLRITPLWCPKHLQLLQRSWHKKTSTSKMKSTILLLGFRRSCWKRTLRISPSKASRTALQTHSLWQTSSRPDSLQSGRKAFLFFWFSVDMQIKIMKIQTIDFVTLNEFWIVVSPLLGFVKKLPENRSSEVVWQTARHVVFDEGFDDGLSERGSAI